MSGEAVIGKKCLKQEHCVNHTMLAPLSASGNEGVKDVVCSVVVSVEPDLQSFKKYLWNWEDL